MGYIYVDNSRYAFWQHQEAVLCWYIHIHSYIPVSSCIRSQLKSESLCAQCYFTDIGSLGYLFTSLVLQSLMITFDCLGYR